MSAPIVERLRDVHHTDFLTRIDAAATITDLLAAAEKALNFIANTESELEITLDSGDALRAAIAKAKGETT